MAVTMPDSKRGPYSVTYASGFSVYLGSTSFQDRVSVYP